MPPGLSRKKIEAQIKDFHGNDAIENGLIRRFKEEDVLRFLQRALRKKDNVAEIRIVCEDANVFPERDINLALITEQLKPYIGELIHFHVELQVSRRHNPAKKVVSLTCEWK